MVIVIIRCRIPRISQDDVSNYFGALGRSRITYGSFQSVSLTEALDLDKTSFEEFIFFVWV
jgi:hypothetical protein